MAFAYEIKKIHQGRFAEGADLAATVLEYLKANDIKAGSVQIIGALSKARLGVYDFGDGEYKTFDVDCESEILSCIGNISMLEGQPFAHLHMIIGLPGGETRGGHVFDNCTIKVCEFQITEYEGEAMQRVVDPSTGLKLWEPEG